MSTWTDPSTWLWPVVLVVGVVVLVRGLALLRRVPARSVADPPQAPAAPTTARSVLDERLARGEVDVEEYRRRRAVLDER